MANHIILPAETQEQKGGGKPFSRVLQDKSSTGKDRCWADRKANNELLARAYDIVDRRKAARLRECATILIMEEWADGSKRLAAMSSCRVRLCPVCSWRRALKTYANTLQCAQWVQREQRGVHWLMLTLTVKNCSGAELRNTLDEMMHGWNRLTQYSDVKRALRGWYRGLEITHDVDPLITPSRYRQAHEYYDRLGLVPGAKNPGFDTFHPHFHCLLAVPPGYFKGGNYISADRWRELWALAMGLDYSPEVRIEKMRVRGDQLDLQHSVAEAAKYSCKPGDYILPDDWELSVATVATLDLALAGRRLIAYGGALRDAHRALNLDDEETGDLIDVGEPQQDHAEPGKMVTYVWHTGYRQYYSI